MTKLINKLGSTSLLLFVALTLFWTPVAHALVPTFAWDLRATTLNQSDDGDIYSSPQVTADAKGNVTAAWLYESSDGTESNIDVNHFFNGRWGVTYTLMSSSDEGHAAYPRLTTDSQGIETIVWTVDVYGDSQIVKAYRSNGKTEDISNPNLESYSPQVTADGQGNVTTVWRSYSWKEGATIYSRRYVNGEWQPIDQLSGSSDSRITHYDARITTDPQGNVTAVWIRDDGSNQIIQAKRFVDGEWQAAIDLYQTQTGQHVDEPQLASDLQGNVMLVWLRDEGSTRSVEAKRFVDGKWQVTTDLSQTGVADSDPEGESPQVTADPQGNVTVVWEFNNGSNQIIQARRFVGGQWKTTIDLSQADHSAYDSKVTADSQGNVTVVWEIRNTDNSVVQARRFVGGKWQATTDLSSTRKGSAWEPNVKADPQGNVTSVWVSYESVDAKRYSKLRSKDITQAR